MTLPKSSLASDAPGTQKPNAAAAGRPRRRGRPAGSRNKARESNWFSPTAVRARLGQIDRELEVPRAERVLLLQVLGQQPLASAPPSVQPRSLPAGSRGRRRSREGGSTLLDLLAQVIERGVPNRGWSVGELRDELAKVAPERLKVPNASSLISAALGQSLRSKSPRFVGTKGSRGRAREYRLALRPPGA